MRFIFRSKITARPSTKGCFTSSQRFQNTSGTIFHMIYSLSIDLSSFLQRIYMRAIHITLSERSDGYNIEYDLCFRGGTSMKKVRFIFRRQTQKILQQKVYDLFFGAKTPKRYDYNGKIIQLYWYFKHVHILWKNETHLKQTLDTIAEWPKTMLAWKVSKLNSENCKIAPSI